MIRDFHFNDIFDIEDLHVANSQFRMPEYGNPANVIKKTIIHDGKIVGSAFVHITSEVGLILDRTLPKLTRAKLIKELFAILWDELEKTDIDDTHIFILPETDTKYADFLIKNFGFVRDTSLVVYKGKKQ